MRRITPTFFALLLMAGGVHAQDTPRETVDVAGLVADASTGEALAGAAVAIEGTGIRTLTNQDGRFVLRGIPAGEQTWVIERLGYATWRQPLAARHLEQLRIGLMARPVALESIRVTVDRLEERRKLAGASVHTVSREGLRSAAAVDAVELIRSAVIWPKTRCPGSALSGGTGVPGITDPPNESSLQDPGQQPSWTMELCVRYRGNVVAPSTCLDDKPMPLPFLAAYGADEIYAVDYIGGVFPQIRLYTERFLESGRPVRPLSFPCG